MLRICLPHKYGSSVYHTNTKPINNIVKAFNDRKETISKQSTEQEKTRRALNAILATNCKLSNHCLCLLELLPVILSTFTDFKRTEANSFLQKRILIIG